MEQPSLLPSVAGNQCADTKTPLEQDRWTLMPVPTSYNSPISSVFTLIRGLFFLNRGVEEGVSLTRQTRQDTQTAQPSSWGYSFAFVRVKASVTNSDAYEQSMVSTRAPFALENTPISSPSLRSESPNLRFKIKIYLLQILQLICLYVGWSLKLVGIATDIPLLVLVPMPPLGPLGEIRKVAFYILNKQT